MGNITVPDRGYPHIKEGGKPEYVFADWMESITRAVNNLAPLTGSGTPETFISAEPGRWYVDTTAAAGSGVYFKESGTGNTGWVLRS